MPVITHSHEGHTIRTFAHPHEDRWVGAYQIGAAGSLIEVDGCTFSVEPDAHWAALRSAKHAIRTSMADAAGGGDA